MIENWLTNINFEIVLRVSSIILIGGFILIMARKYVRKVVTEYYNQHYGMLVGKIIYYVGIVILFVSALHEMGFRLGPILGAAGIIGIAIGFAAQTTVSNLISGFFLVAEKPFEIGDVISVNGNVGSVLSIDSLSVKVRLFDNRYLRIPNESLLKNEMINVTRFPIRRVEFKISVAYKEDMDKVRRILFEVADKNPVALQEPAPMLIFDSFASSSIDFTFNIWCARPEFLNLRNTLYPDIKKRFDEEGIEIPFPHVSLYKGEATDPIPIRIMGDFPEMPEIPVSTTEK
jgi:small-conductance mechanosensitive channel